MLYNICSYLPNLLNSDIEAVAQAYSPAPSLVRHLIHSQLAIY